MLRRHLLHFGVAGSIGFLVDAGLTQLLVVMAGAEPLLARVLGVAAAIAVTFSYNRSITFADRTGGALWPALLRYLAGNSAGLVANYSAFMICLSLWPWLRTWPALAVAAGALVGMSVNFVAARYFVFVRESGSD